MHIMRGLPNAIYVARRALHARHAVSRRQGYAFDARHALTAGSLRIFTRWLLHVRGRQSPVSNRCMSNTDRYIDTCYTYTYYTLFSLSLHDLMYYDLLRFKPRLPRCTRHPPRTSTPSASCTSGRWPSLRTLTICI